MVAETTLQSAVERRGGFPVRVSPAAYLFTTEFSEQITTLFNGPIKIKAMHALGAAGDFSLLSVRITVGR